MIKSFFAALLATPFIAGPAAIAGPYANVEANTSFTGSDYEATIIEPHLGYEVEFERASVYFQGGPAIISEQGEEQYTEFSAKVGGDLSVKENVDVYGEISMLTDEGDNNYGVKTGLTYRF